jgi:protein-tyrosine phosphatase
MWIEFDGILNARDLGGIPAADGRRVRAGRLLRGAGLAHASDADLARLETEIRLRHIVDFRDANECERAPDRAVPGAEYHNIPALTALPKTTFDTEGLPDFAAIFRRVYGKFAVSEETRAAYRAFFRVLLDCQDGAVYFHCTQGKDRTGIAAILALTALGVSLPDAEADYFLSREGLREAMEHPESPGADRWPQETKEQLFLVFPENLNIYLDQIAADWGGLEDYLRRGIGLTDGDLARLRELYLE